jgi:hypothetical protein
MAVSIQYPAKCEVRAVIRFIHAKVETAAEIHRQDVHDEIRSGRPSVITDEIIQNIDENIRADRRLTIDELHQQCPEVPRTVLHG